MQRALCLIQLLTLVGCMHKLDDSWPDGRVPDGVVGPDASLSCGNGQKEDNEQCDGDDLGGQSCTSLGFDSGALGCYGNCILDARGCDSHDYVLFQAGVFLMGSPIGELCREMREPKETQHQVTLTNAFEVFNHEVTQGEFQSELNYTPAWFKQCGGECPVEKITWHEAVAYCNALSKGKSLKGCYDCQGSGKDVTCTAAFDGEAIYQCPGYRLPTEAEWEHAYRAGASTPFYNGDIMTCDGADTRAEEIAWYAANCQMTPHRARQKKPNDKGLYDMAGNVWEWCHDWYRMDLEAVSATDPWGPSSGSAKIIRGGSWDSPPNELRAAMRWKDMPGNRADNIGFRCVRTRK